MRKVDLRNGYRVGKDLGTVRKDPEAVMLPTRIKSIFRRALLQTETVISMLAAMRVSAPRM